MICKKCNSQSSVTLRKKDEYCDICFTTNINHKFRACIGKSKILPSNEDVLICVSGGDASTVLLDLVYNGISLDSHKKLRINPRFLYLMNGDDSIAAAIIEQCQKYNCDVYIVSMSEYFNKNLELPSVNSIPKVNHERQNKLDSLLKNMSPSIASDFLPKLKRTLYIMCAEKLQCNYIFTAETNSTLAINLLTNLAIGRGSQVQNDVGFSDTRSEKIKILRPMKDISKEELKYYISIRSLVSITNNDNQPNRLNSLHSVISNFVTDLQKNFQSTISTVCKTADKIGLNGDNSIMGYKCVICESNLEKIDLKLTAFEATNFSRMMSQIKPEDKCIKSLDAVVSDSDHIRKSNNMCMFPLIYKQLCYSCSRNYSEMDYCALPVQIQQLLQKEKL